ncbi:MAG: hypothetical protein IH786_04360 [Proteobacteria bacterium]|nr:hypothetical protein [Pseudomonadota bacterium]
MALLLSALRLRRLGLIERSLAEMTRWQTFRLVAPALMRRYGRILWPFRRNRRLTETYLSDPAIVPSAA